MNADLIAAVVLFGPSAVALPALAVAWHRSNTHADAERALFTDLHTRTTPPSSPGDPLPAPLAPVIHLTPRRRAA